MMLVWIGRASAGEPWVWGGEENETSPTNQGLSPRQGGADPTIWACTTTAATRISPATQTECRSLMGMYCVITALEQRQRKPRFLLRGD